MIPPSTSKSGDVAVKPHVGSRLADELGLVHVEHGEAGVQEQDDSLGTWML
jgi:hypothetical protein